METIKRYNNRKLYSMTLSKYVTINYIIDLVKTHQKFVVVDANSVNITNKVLKSALNRLTMNDSTITSLIRGL